ncbi:MAG: alpha/beta hydrolase, partial [Verrucomicrobia bacterium]|nr:alpha/beta hydrolase [Verrucomicrobiota bacterium]
MNLRCLGWMTAALLLGDEAARGDDVLNARVMLRPIGRQGQWMGMDVHDRASGQLITPLRFASNGAIFADRLLVDRKEKDGQVIQTVRFQDLRGRLGSGLGLGDHDWASVQLNGDDPLPRVDFSLTITSFVSSEWERFQGGPCPFNFLTLRLPGAEVWHQRGWLMATPKSDPFVLQQDVAFGGGSVAGEFSRNWSYVCALGGSPMPVIGLWAPAARHYVGLEFQGARMSDNTERDVCTAYCWQQGEENQLVAVCYPHSEEGYRRLAYPPRQSRIASHATLMWSLDMPSTSDPNRWLHQRFTERYANAAPPVPHTPNVGYMPGATRLRDWPQLPPPRLVVRRARGDKFTVPGTVEIGGWNWYAESPVEAAYARHDTNALAALREDLNYLIQRARVFHVGGDPCIFWDKPVEGRWRDEWGGEPVRSLHNANGFAVGIAMTDLWRHEHARNPQETANLPAYIDGVYHWAKHMVWTRNEFSDVPASPFAIGATLPAVFLLDYYFTFRHTPERAARARAA